MICPCGKSAKCVDSRQHDKHRRRRYKCGCGERFSTVEVIRSFKSGRSSNITVNTLNDQIKEDKLITEKLDRSKSLLKRALETMKGI